MAADPVEEVERVTKGVRSFVESMREQGIHVGVGTGTAAICATCGEDWPCKASGAENSDG